MKKIIKRILLVFITIFLVVAGFLFIGTPPVAENINWGMNFSQKHAQLLGLDWKEAYLALLDGLGAKNLKVAVHWDSIELEDGIFNFEDLDWQINEAGIREAKILLAIGMKTPRWPECHIPDWAKNLNKDQQQEKILRMLEEIIKRYGNLDVINYWQVENEPFFPFGECSWVDKNFLKKEIELVKSLDSLKRPVVITDSGEGSFWISAARFGDIVGTTMYQKVWFSQIDRYISYPLPPTFYWRKAKVIERLFDKKVMVVELQAEPWGPKLMYDISLEEQAKTMNLHQFKENIEFAKKTGLEEFYLWGGEWMYWMKEKQDDPRVWDEAKKLF